MKGGDETGVTALMILLEIDQPRQTLAVTMPYSELYYPDSLPHFVWEV